MLSKCANPDCTTTLHYLREGKVFKIESDTPFLVGEKKPMRRVEHFWLCGPCSGTMTLINDPDYGIQLVRKGSLMMKRAAAS